MSPKCCKRGDGDDIADVNSIEIGPRRANNSQIGMQGVYLVAAELTGQEFIVSVTSRNARGADLLVTDQGCQRAWSVQVKATHQNRGFWLLGEDAKNIKSPTHVYVFVNLKGKERPAYYVVPSEFVAANVKEDRSKKSGKLFYYLNRTDAEPYLEKWNFFG